MCCAVQETAFVCGIILVVLNLLICFQGDFKSIVQGIVFASINSILVIGAHTRNRTAILVWMIVAIIEIIFLIGVCHVCTFLISFMVIPQHGGFQLEDFLAYVWYISTIFLTIVTTFFASIFLALE